MKHSLEIEEERARGASESAGPQIPHSEMAIGAGSIEAIFTGIFR